MSLIRRGENWRKSCTAITTNDMTQHEKLAELNRIGVLTLHYGFNEGAVLQAMATCELAVELGFSPEVVDHRYPAKQAVYGRAETPREEAIQNAINEWLPLSKKCYESDSREETFSFCSDRYKSLIVGSDVVWALHYVRRLRRVFPRGIFPRQSNPFFPAFPNVYWPDEKVECNKIVYAASCGDLDPKIIPKSHILEMARILDGYAGISVRDSKSLELVRLCSPELAERTVVVPDPTVAINLLDVFDGSSALWKLEQRGFDPAERWALLVMKEDKVSGMALRMLKAQGYLVAATGKYGGQADIDLVQCGLSPLEWGWMPRFFRINVTERMHSSIFTILNRTPLLALDMNRKVAGSMTKLEELMAGLGLLSCYIHQEDVSEEKVVEQLIDRVTKGLIDWDDVERRISSQRDLGRTYLEAALGK